MNKAERGELLMRLPVGFVYDAQNRVVLDPDRQVQSSIRMLFDTFERVGSELATVRELGAKNLQFPTRPHFGRRSRTYAERRLISWPKGPTAELRFFWKGRSAMTRRSSRSARRCSGDPGTRHEGWPSSPGRQTVGLPAAIAGSRDSVHRREAPLETWRIS